MQNQNSNQRVHRYALRPRNGRQLQRDGGNRVTTKKITAPPSKRRRFADEDVKENDEWYRSLERPSKILRAVNHAEGSMGPNEVLESELSAQDLSDTSIALGAFSLSAFATAAERQCIASQDLLDFSATAVAAQVDDNVVNFDADNAEAGENVDMNLNVDAEVDMNNSPSYYADISEETAVESSTNEQINSSEVAEAERKKRKKLQRAMALLDCKLDGKHWTEAPKRKLPRELECNLGGYWTEVPRRRRINRA